MPAVLSQHCYRVWKQNQLHIEEILSVVYSLPVMASARFSSKVLEMFYGSISEETEDIPTMEGNRGQNVRLVTVVCRYVVTIPQVQMSLRRFHLSF